VKKLILLCLILKLGKIVKAVVHNPEAFMIANMPLQEEWKTNLIIFGVPIMKELELG